MDWRDEAYRLRTTPMPERRTFLSALIAVTIIGAVLSIDAADLFSVVPTAAPSCPDTSAPPPSLETLDPSDPCWRMGGPDMAAVALAMGGGALLTLWGLIGVALLILLAALLGIGGLGALRWTLYRVADPNPGQAVRPPQPPLLNNLLAIVGVIGLVLGVWFLGPLWLDLPGWMFGRLFG